MNRGLNRIFAKFIVTLFMFFVSCNSPEKKEVVLFKTNCASCHLLPNINDVPKEIWANKILPDMAARMGIKDGSYSPLKGFKYVEMEAILASNIYSNKPYMTKKEWELLKNYIVNLAPDSLLSNTYVNKSKELDQFKAIPISLDSSQGSLITFLQYNKKDEKLWTGDINGNLKEYDFLTKKTKDLFQFESALVDFTDKDTISYATIVGDLNPSEIPSGKIVTIKKNNLFDIEQVLHRPVNNLVIDLNDDGNDELVISEFGNLTGELSLLTKEDKLNYTKTTLLNQPGTIRVISRDMNKDGKKDLIALTSQGDETITILYQLENLKFRSEKVLRFSPIYGTSWFELIDYDGDGDDDIITVNGDNADKSYVQKPYHGMRIHINNGENVFEEKYFFPLNGATRLVANDFDQDGDVDFGLISTFPDYKNNPEFSFVYLQNTNENDFIFDSFTFKESNLGRWFLMDTGDVDNDGDEDIILSSFTYVFTPVPDDLSKLWKEKNVDIMLLENKLKSLKKKN